MNRILISPNAFKGSMTAAEAAKAIRTGIDRAMRDVAQSYALTELPLADGGDGTLETLVQATGGERIPCRVEDPLGRPITACWGRLGGEQRHVGVVEMALASGLTLLTPDEYAPAAASTYGTGQLMLEAIRSGCTSLIVAIGGSATTDGGAGMAQALGARLLNRSGEEIGRGGAALHALHRVDLSERLPIERVEVVVACDVDNPLCGPRGAARVYGPQKGATPTVVESLDASLQHYAQVLEAHFGREIGSIPGAGAAGGLGAGLMAFCGAALHPGLEIVMDAVDFDLNLRQSSLVITGEGRLDTQTAHGKLIWGISQRALLAGVPVVALTGSIEPGSESLLRTAGLTAALPIADKPMSLSESMERGPSLLAASAERLIHLIRVRDLMRQSD